MYAHRHEGELLNFPIVNNFFLLLTLWMAKVSVFQSIHSFSSAFLWEKPLRKGGDASLGREQMILYLTLLHRKAIMDRAMIKTYKRIGNKFQTMYPWGPRPGVIYLSMFRDSWFYRRAGFPRGPKCSPDTGEWDHGASFNFFFFFTFVYIRMFP